MPRATYDDLVHEVRRRSPSTTTQALHLAARSRARPQRRDGVAVHRGGPRRRPARPGRALPRPARRHGLGRGGARLAAVPYRRSTLHALDARWSGRTGNTHGIYADARLGGSEPLQLHPAAAVSAGRSVTSPTSPRTRALAASVPRRTSIRRWSTARSRSGSRGWTSASTRRATSTRASRARSGGCGRRRHGRVGRGADRDPGGRMSLQWVGQDDFAAGTLRRARDRTSSPASGVERAINGALRRRRRRLAARRRSTGSGPTPAPAPLTFIWSGLPRDQLRRARRHRRQACTRSQVNGAFVDLGAPGLRRAGAARDRRRPRLPAQRLRLGRLAEGDLQRRARSPPPPTSPIVTGAGTAVGGQRRAGDADPRHRRLATYRDQERRVRHLADHARPAARNAAAAGLAYTIVASGHRRRSRPPTCTRHLGTVGGPAADRDRQPDRVLRARDQPFTFDPTDYHELPDGVVVQGMSSIRDRVLVFSNYGLWSITNMAST